MRIYVGNLSYQATSDDLNELFGAYGEVSEATVVTDRDTGRSRGFGFVEMATNAVGQAAIDGLKGKYLQGRELDVSEARPRTDSRRGGGRGGFGGGKKRRAY